MDLSAINWLAVVAAALVGFAVGFLWYGPLFGKPWMAAAGLSEEQLAAGNMAKIFGLSLVLQFVMAFFLAIFFFGDPEAADMVNAGNGTLYGFLTGFGWVAMAIGVTALFEQRPTAYALINGGFWIVVFTLMGLILGAWR